MSDVAPIPDVCFIDDVARALRVSRSTIERLRRFNAFPIPTIPALDNKRPRWSGKNVREFIDNQVSTRSKLRRVG